MQFEELKGKTLVSVTGEIGGKVMLFTCADGDVFELGHDQDCCETVQIEDICGDLSDLVGEVVMADESSAHCEDEDLWSKTWTFYRIATANGYVTVRWLGESNGYYSESVSFRKVER